MLCIQDALNLVQTFSARLLPAREGVPAEITGARGHTVRVETSILVERNEVRSVRGAEDMTTVTTVVSTQEQTKGGAAGGRVAVGRSRVRLRLLLASLCSGITPFAHHFRVQRRAQAYIYIVFPRGEILTFQWSLVGKPVTEPKSSFFIHSSSANLLIIPLLLVVLSMVERRLIGS